MSTDEGFLSRWVRLKQAAKQATPVNPEAQQAAPQPSAPPSRTGAEQAPAPPPEEAPPDLPSVESLTAQSDIAAFMRKGVPEALKMAALRKMWALDPAIRDYVGLARDYGDDWNVPGGVAGAGPLSPSDDPQRILARLFEVGGTPGERATSAPPNVEVAAEDIPTKKIDLNARELCGAAEPLPEAKDTRIAAPAPVERVPVRRHGGAVPHEEPDAESENNSWAKPS